MTDSLMNTDPPNGDPLKNRYSITDLIAQSPTPRTMKHVHHTTARNDPSPMTIQQTTKTSDRTHIGATATIILNPVESPVHTKRGSVSMDTENNDDFQPVLRSKKKK